MKTFFLFWTAATAALSTGQNTSDTKHKSSSRINALREHDAFPKRHSAAALDRNSATAASKGGEANKNIILFMTDDQDVTHKSIDRSVMPKLNRLFREGGMEFEKYYVSTGLCCPCRTTILRGQYCHNTKIFDNGNLNNSTYRSGGWRKFSDTGLEDETIATLLQSAGYETALIGKYMNGYELNGKKTVPPKPAGWDHWMGLLNVNQFYGPVVSEDGKRILRTNKTVYQTDFIRDYVLDFLTNRRDPSKPFFLMVTPHAPHSPATPAHRHEHLFPNAKFPRYDSFNPSDSIQQQQSSWIKGLPKLTEKQIKSMDNFYRRRLQSLQAVDEALESITETLDNLGLTDETYFIYTSDNGQHFGDHREPAGKRQAYESDVLVPFLVRGPGIPKGSTSSQVVQNVDLGPTFLEIASTQTDSNNRLKPTYPMDGKSILPLLRSNPHSSNYNDFRWAALLEMYGGSSNMGKEYEDVKGYFHNYMFPNTYQAVRVVDGPDELIKNANLLYVEWCTGEQELYNVTVDAHQVYNLLAPAVSSEDKNGTRTNSELLPLIHKLSRLLARLGDCVGSDCYDLEDQSFELGIDQNSDIDVKRALSLESMKSAIRNRIPCHNPSGFPGPASEINMQRKPFAHDRRIPEPFTHGFPFSDADYVPDDLLEIWAEYQHYFS